MLFERYRELCTAGPHITREDFKRFQRNPWMPKLTPIALSVRVAFSKT